jgi:hypothetical protein
MHFTYTNYKTRPTHLVTCVSRNGTHFRSYFMSVSNEDIFLFTLLQASWPWRGGRGIALPILNLGIRGGGWSAPRPDRFTPGKDPVPIAQEAGCAPEPVWTCEKNLTPTGIRSSDRPVRSQSLYRLSYPAHSMKMYAGKYGLQRLPSSVTVHKTNEL